MELRRVAVASLVLAVLAGTACASSASSRPAVDDPATTAEQALDSAVGILTQGCGLVDARASGVVAGDGGLVVTVAHVLAGADFVSVVDGAGEPHAATVVWFDPDSDIAVVRAPSLTNAPLALTKARAGDVATVATWASDASIELKPASVVRRITVTIEDIYIEDTVERAGLEIEADIERGDSGGPVIVDDRLAGIIYANSRRRSNIGFALDHTEIREALDSVVARADTGPCL